MAYSGEDLVLATPAPLGNGSEHWMYATDDSSGTLTGAGYFSDGGGRGLKVGDIIWAINTSGPSTTILQVSAVSKTGHQAATAVAVSTGGGGGLTPIPAATLLANPTGGSATPVGTPIGNGIGLTGTTVGLAAIPSLSVIGNAGSVSAVPSSLVLSPSSFIVANGTIGTNGTLSALNLTTGTGILFNNQVFSNAGTNQATYLGLNAGAVAQSGTVTPGLGCTFIGDSSGQHFTTGSECTFIGALAGQMMLTGGGCVAVGEHALGYDTAGNGSVAIGGDAMRNWTYSTGSGNSNGYGTDSLYNGSGDSDVGVGNFAQRGTPSTLLISGTVTNGETITVTFTGSFPGSPLAIPYVTTSTSLGTTATGLAAAINANSTAVAQLSKGTPNPANVEDTNNIFFGWVGNSLWGDAVVATASTTGTAVLTVLGGYTGSNNTSVGTRSMEGYYLTTAANNSTVGVQSFRALQSGSGNVGMGYQAGLATSTGSSNVFIGNQVAIANLAASFNTVVGPNAFASYNGSNGSHVAIGQAAMGNFTNAALQCVAVGANALQGAVGTTASGCTAVGYQSFKALTTGSFNVGLGYQTGAAATTGARLTLAGYGAGSLITTGANATIIGAQVGSTTFVSGSNVILIGTSTSVDTPLAATSNYLNIGNVLTGTGINTAATSTITVPGTLALGANPVTASTTNTITNKMAVNINGTTYYVLISTSPT